MSRRRSESPSPESGVVDAADAVRSGDAEAGNLEPDTALIALGQRYEESEAMGMARALPKVYARGWRRAVQGSHEPAILRALFRVATGESLTEAKEAEGCSRSHLWKLARRYGLGAPGKAQLLEGQRRLSKLSGDLLEQRMTDDPDDVSTRDLTVIGGVAIDKIANAEGWGRIQQGDVNYGSALESVAARIIEGGGTIELTIKPRDPDAEAIDITPEPEPT